MSDNLSIQQFMRSLADGLAELSGFQATQRVIAPGIEIEAAVHVRKPASIRVEYRTYKSALLASEEELTSTALYSSEELEHMVFSTDGRVSWAYDPANQVAIRSPQVVLQEPIPGLATLGEVSFLRTLTQDFLVRDLGTQEVSGRRQRKIAVKPKTPYRSYLLRAVSFPVVHAKLSIDEETRLPSRITLAPAPDSPAATLLGASQQITIEYDSLRIDPPEIAAPSFAPPEGTTIFAERAVSLAELFQSVQPPVSFDSLEAAGFSLLGNTATLAKESGGDRFFATVRLVRSSEEDSPQQLLVLFGNYLSRRMSRMRTACREQGEAIEPAGAAAWHYDHAPQWESLVPGMESGAAPADIHWESDHWFWFASTMGLTSKEALALTSSLQTPEDTADQSSEPA